MGIVSYVISHRPGANDISWSARMDVFPLYREEYVQISVGTFCYYLPVVYTTLSMYSYYIMYMTSSIYLTHQIIFSLVYNKDNIII